MRSLLSDVDIVAPCAAGGVITEWMIDGLKARMIIAAANNVLADNALAGELISRGIVHVPDFVSNAGGVICCEAEVLGSFDGVEAKVDAIADTTTAVLEEASTRGLDVVTVADEQAARRLEAHRRQPPFSSR